MAGRKLRGLDQNDYVDKRQTIRDIRTGGQRFLENFRGRTTAAWAIAGGGLAGFFLPAFMVSVFLLSLIIFAIHLALTSGAGLPFRMPLSAHMDDPNSLAPGGRKLNQAGGIIYLGNDKRTGQELWLEKKDILTHMLLMGTTGSGKTETLVSLSFNALATGSGLFYIDPKAAPQLAVQIWQMARYLGRDDDFRVLNYGTSGKDLKVARVTNTNNPFSIGNADSLTQILASLMPPVEGGNAVFADKALTLISGVMIALVDLRDKGIIQLSVSKIRETLSAENCVKLSTHAGLSPHARESICSALSFCNYVPSKDLGEQDAFFEQFGYAQSYFGRALSSLSDTYGHIYGVECGEVDMQDVVLHRRILVTMLPAMEKSTAELASLGKITLSSIRAAAAVGLGMSIEGRERDVLGALPIHFRGTGPFLSVVDEYAAIVTPGFEILLTQGRGLGMATIVASQDYAGIDEADKKGAQQIVANTAVKAFMKLQEPEKTWRLLKDLAGQETVMETTGFHIDRSQSGHDYTDNFGTSVRTQDIVDLRDLMQQTEGEVHFIFGGAVVRGDMFYANPNLKGAVLKVPRMIQMEPMLS